MSAGHQNGVQHNHDSKFGSSASHIPSNLDPLLMPRNHTSYYDTSSGNVATSSAASAPRLHTRRDSTIIHPGPRAFGQSAHGAHESKDQIPAWTDLKTKAGKVRKRLPLACIACRRKKVRCSGEKPACKHCLKSRQPCVYKVTARKAAPRTDYMAMLDKRLKRMEDRVLKVIPKEEMQNVPDIARAVVKPPPPGSQAKTVKKRSAEEAFSVTGPDRSSDRDAQQARQQSPRRAHHAKQADESSLLSDGKEYLPSDELQRYLANVYFDYVYGQSYHLLHKPSFMRRLEAGTIPPMLMLAVCAVSARFATHPQLRTMPAFLRGDNWAKASLEIALKRFDSPNIATLTVFLLLGLHTLGTCQGGQSWMLGGMALRMAYALRIHEEIVRDGDNDSFTDREIRRRTMWSCFLMDRFMSSGSERPMFADEENINIQLPIKEQLFQMEVPGPTEHLDGSSHNPAGSRAGQMSDPKANMGVASYTTRLLSLWGHLIAYFNQKGKEKDQHPMWSPQSTYRKLYSEIDGFRKALPESLYYNDDNLKTHAADGVANQFLFMHVIYQQCVLTLNEFAVPTTALAPPPKDIPLQFLMDARKTATDAAVVISRLIERGSNYRLVAPFAGYCAYVSSAVHIYGVMSRNSQLEASSRECLGINIRYLSRMKECWGMFVHLVQRLRDLYQLRVDAVAQGIRTPNARLNQKSVFQYGDWYDHYPHGVSKSDYEVPEVDVKKEDGDDSALSQRPIMQSVDDFFASLTTTPQTQPVKKGGRKKSGAAAPSHSSDRGQGEVSSFSQHMDHHINLPRSPFGIPESYDRSQIQPQQQPPPIQDTSRLAVPSAIDPYSFQQVQQPNMLPQFDRQLVLASWNGMDQTAAMPGTTGAPWDMDMNGFGDDLMLVEPSNAWFMPFNLDPREFAGTETGQYVGQPLAGPQDGWYAQSDGSHSIDGSLARPNGP